MQALAPVRLSAERQLEILRRIHAQDPIDLSSDDVAMLVQATTGMVLQLAAPYARDRDLHEDVVQAGRMGILHAIQTFDLSRGLQFSTHCKWQIRSRISDELDRYNRFCRRNRATDPVVMETATAPASVEADSPDEIARRLDTRQRSDRLLKFLPQRQRAIVCMYYGIDSESLKYREIADRLGIKKSQVHSELQTARERMKRHRNSRQQLMDFGE